MLKVIEGPWQLFCVHNFEHKMAKLMINHVFYDKYFFVTVKKFLFHYSLRI